MPFKSYWTETKSVTTTPTTTTTQDDDAADDADGQHDPYVSAKLQKRLADAFLIFFV